MAALISPLTADLRVLIVAGDPLARAGLSALLADQCNVVGGLESPSLETINFYAPDALLWDLGYNPTSALEQMADLRDAALNLNIVALLLDDSTAPDAWVAGARGLMLRSASAETLAAALNSVAQRLIVLDPALSGLLLSPREKLYPATSVEDLTARESQVLQLLAEGLPNKGIARRLKISEHTVKFHVNAILSKLGVQSRTEAVVRANRLGMIIL